MHLSSKARNDSDNYKKNAEIKMLGVTEAKTSTLKEIEWLHLSLNEFNPSTSSSMAMYSFKSTEQDNQPSI